MAIINLWGRRVGDGQPVFIIAEIGINHQGKKDLAHKLIDAAADAGADAVKFQKRNLDKMYQKKLLKNSNLGEQGLAYLIPLLKDIEFGRAEYLEFMEHAKQRGLSFLCTAWDEDSLNFLEDLNLQVYKIASADLTNYPLLQQIAATKKPLIISSGMAAAEEIKNTAGFLKSLHANFALLHCVGAYPAPVEDLNLRFLPELKKQFPEVPVGYSGHERGFYPTLAAVALGATIIERHITLDRQLPGPDHIASLEPNDFKTMVTAIREVERSLGAAKKIRSHAEQANRKILGKALVAARNIKTGQIIRRSDITVKGPAKGLSPSQVAEIVGRPAVRDLSQDDFFLPSDIGVSEIMGTVPKFQTPWALKTRFSEIDFAESFQPPIFEFHLSDRDVLSGFIPKKRYSQQLYVHAPDYMGHRVKDLASLDENHWEESIAFCQKAIDLVRRMARFFSGPPVMVIHVGGASPNPESSDKQRLLERSLKAFRRLSYDGITLLPENLPPRGWYFSGQWFNHIFSDSKEVVTFAKELGLRVCLDLAHARLHCNVYGDSYRDFIQMIVPHVSHIHVADASGLTHEGLQIGDGEIDFTETFQVLNKFSGWTWCPEIWEGHLNDYEGFRVALKRLKPYIK